jgi:hypothetical protein
VRGIIRREPGREDSTNGEEDDEDDANRSQRIALREPWKRNGGGGKVFSPEVISLLSSQEEVRLRRIYALLNYIDPSLHSG